MNPKPPNAGLAERLRDTYIKGYGDSGYLLPTQGWRAVAAEVRRIVKEATKEGRK